MIEVPGSVSQAARWFGLDASALRPLGGKSGSSWDAGSWVLRVGRRARMDTELVAAKAAAQVVPVPRVMGRVEVGDDSAVLLEKLRGQPAGDLARQQPAVAYAAGRACGAVYSLLAGIAPPADLPPVRNTPSGLNDGAPASVLHLDLHPFNLLVSEKAELTGVLDWANAAAGPAVLDRARSWAILTLDPAALARRHQRGWLPLADGWAEAAGLPDIPAAGRVWACRYMLTDLAHRNSPGDLKHVSEALAQAEAEAAGR